MISHIKLRMEKIIDVIWNTNIIKILNLFLLFIFFIFFFSFSQLLILQNRKKKWLENKISSAKILKKYGFNTYIIFLKCLISLQVTCIYMNSIPETKLSWWRKHIVTGGCLPKLEMPQTPRDWPRKRVVR